MDTLICPKGHPSSDQDYCSECGAKIANGRASAMGNGTGNALGNGSGATAAGLEICPDCATPRENKGVAFCEICGYNFATGARGEAPMSPMESTVVDTFSAEAAPMVEQAATSVEQAIPLWSVMVSVDHAVPGPGSPPPPTDFVPFTIALEKPVSLIGRTSQTRAIFPEISIDCDDAVSHRHALLQIDSNGALAVRDIGAANGIMVNGKERMAMVDHPLNDGDAITLGHWSRLTVKATMEVATA